MVIEEHIPLIDEILDNWKTVIGRDYPGYRNHVYRMVNFCFALQDCTSDERHKVIIAGCLHDLGIWANDTFDYLSPSVVLAKTFLQQNGLTHWSREIELMIDLHHKLRPYRDARYPLVEVFRKGDLVDFSLGLVKCGLPAAYVKSVQRRIPDAGFHKRLVQLELGWFPKHPFNPIPVLKW
jgi:hypothetical protein